jgi:hypothetical protein
VIGTDVVSYAVNPCSQAATLIKPLQTAPKFYVHLLKQIALSVCVRFIPADQAPHALPVLSLSLNVKLILIVGTQS